MDAVTVLLNLAASFSGVRRVLLAYSILSGICISWQFIILQK